MSRCVILGAGPVTEPSTLLSLLSDDDIYIAADGGQTLAQRLGIPAEQITAVIGDFDSSVPAENGVKQIALPVRKDVTDTDAAAKIACDKGIRDFLILGGIGGRLDHELANFRLLVRLSRHGGTVQMADGHNLITVYRRSPPPLDIPPGRHLSLFAFGGTVHGLTIRHAAYELTDYDLAADDSLCVSNEGVGVPCKITFTDGILIVCFSE